MTCKPANTDFAKMPKIGTKKAKQKKIWDGVHFQLAIKYT